MRSAFRTVLAILSVASLAPAVVAAAAPVIKYYPRANKPFSSAIRIGNQVFISGVVGTAADGTMPTDFGIQATNTMDAVAKNLKLAGATMDDVYECTIVLTNMDNWAAFNAVYVKYFKPDRFPVRISFGATDLRGASVEVQCEAFIR